MSRINLKSITTGPTSKIFETDDLGTLIADIQSTESMNPENAESPENNQFNMYDITNGNMIHNIYPLADLKVRSYHTTKRQSELTNSIDDYIEIYIPNTTYNKICQHNDFTFLLSDLTIQTPQTYNILSADTSDYPDIRYIKSLQSIPANTYVYPPSSVVETYGLSAAIPVYNLSAIQHNYFVEVPNDDSYFFWRDGQILGDATTTKNVYDVFYNMNSNVISADSNSVSATLDDCRTYQDINSTGDLLYMTYDVDSSYFSPTSAESIILPGENPASIASSAYTITSIEMSAEPITLPDVSAAVDYHSFQHVEVVKSLNRFTGVDGHKSNLYSINIQNAGINTLDSLDAENKTNIKKSINNIIRDITKVVMPLNTQLFDIYWTGD